MPDCIGSSPDNLLHCENRSREWPRRPFRRDRVVWGYLKDFKKGSMTEYGSGGNADEKREIALYGFFRWYTSS